ncbi:dienelactone hydrolase [Amycolatopsis bartoniae]|uniref:Alpha/beta hydrolase n=1 Tax=Amycolatopsis bartoniae TaxID=941986 RepID=A0A8H9J3D4_9PSEU|nr:alpha/beta hydrolase [Amycolatopsis bartoniae]MBB2936479.1 dienelactone hydrolase [Amycolatopsis bartoniae]GHF68648.1 hypothetical protein GCM10017566_48110 [Amycolatopsis bartoniae]
MHPTALRLPEPTGPHPVGATPLHLVDSARPDPWVPERPRELMVTLWYPAPAAGERRTAYLTPVESEHLLTGIPDVPRDILSTTRTHAFADAPPLADRERPLVLLSPGFTKPRATLTGLAEDLASHGYVVAAIEHTHESVATTFPDGRVATCQARNFRRDEAFWDKLATGRAADVSFVLDELTRTLAPSGIGMAGHSAGGASALTALAVELRLQAAIGIDGTVHSVPPGLSRPFLFLGRESQYTPGSGPAAATWEDAWHQLTGWKRWFTVAGAAHASFTDLALLAEQAGLGLGPATLPAARVSELTRCYVRAFFDQHLRGEPQSCLDTPPHAEVVTASL